jgi:hypothetical protein
MKKLRCFVKICGSILAIFAVFILVVGSMHREIFVQYSDGSSIRVRPSSFWWSVVGFIRQNAPGCVSSCEVSYKPKNREEGKVVFWQDMADRPIVVFPAREEPGLLCLYDWDTSAPLLRIDPTKAFVRPQKGHWSRVGAIVCSSPWAVEEARNEDWQYALSFLKSLTPVEFSRIALLGGLDVGVARVHGADELADWIKEVEIHGHTDRWE